VHFVGLCLSSKEVCIKLVTWKNLSNSRGTIRLLPNGHSTSKIKIGAQKN